ncbi:MAG: exosortase U, partial [Planctomycetaceae bacterium]
MIHRSRTARAIGIGKSIPRWQILSVALLLLAHLPYLYVQALNTLSRPHYQFALLVPIVLVAVTQRRVPRIRRLWRVRRIAPAALRRVTLALFFVLLLDVMSLWLRSPWLGTVAFIWLVLALIYWVGGWGLVRQLAPIWCICWLCLPIPFGWDYELVLWLRTMATQMTSATLDVIGITHLMYGNVIELPQRSLYVADACSGIHSLFVIVAFAMLYGVWFRRSRIATLLLMVSAFGIVMLENIGRLTAVALAAHFNRNLAEGWKHETLGFALFGLSLLLVVTTDQLIRFLLPRGGRPRHKLPSTKQPLLSSKREESKPPTVSSSVQRPVLLPVLAIAVALIIAPLQLTRLPAQIHQLRHVMPTAFSLPEFGEDSLPEQIAGFSRVDYQIVERVPDDPLGETSQIWQYRSKTTALQISIDYPFSGPHDLSVCYRQTGWQIDESKIVSAESDEIKRMRADDSFVEVHMSRPLFGFGQLLFSQCSLNGQNAIRLRSTERAS